MNTGLTRASGAAGPRRLRRLVRAVSLALFLGLLWLSAFPLMQSLIPVDLFLRLDPAAGTIASLAAREWIPNFFPALLLLLLTVAFGRIFCGFICPLGITLDAARFLFSSRKRGPAHGAPPSSLKHLKYLVLALFTGSALLGVNLVFWGSPISLATRLYSLLLHPLLTLFGSEGLNLGTPLFESLRLTSLSYEQIAPRRFDTVYFLFALFALLFFLERIRPRFWCRYVCPAGALFGLFSLRPLRRRHVHECIHCGRCARDCPTAAISATATVTVHPECIGCRSCVAACPVRGVRFAMRGPKLEKIPDNLPLPAPSDATRRCPEPQEGAPENARSARPGLLDRETPLLPSRRAFLTAAGTGATLACLGHISAASLLPGAARGAARQTGGIRPPGARPEKDFLARCLRCGQCMKVCPTGGLQPTWFVFGVEGIFSPALVSRTGPCEPECSACGAVCPSEAVIPLPLEEKQQAKIGTAVVQPDLCLAWAQGHSCVVCQEVCPYGAISLEQKGGAKVPVPVVKARQCFGCGYCEYHCPVFIPAITVQPLNSLRLNRRDYREAARAAGLDLKPVSRQQPIAPSFEEIPEGSLPPGFSE